MMKRKNIWKKTISLLLVFSLILGIGGMGSWVFASGTTDSLPEELKDYTRITLGDFNIEASTETEGTKYTEQKESSYTRETLNKTYLDVDVNFHGGTGSSYFQYLHKSDWSQYVRVIHYGDGLSTFEGANTSNSVWMAEPSNNKFINLKLSVDMIANASDNTQSDITLKIWVDNVYQGTLQFTAKTEELKNIYIVGSEASPISFRTPTEQKVELPDISDELEGYTRITMENFGIDASTENAGTKYIEQKESSYTGETLNKTYLDVDVNFHGGTGSSYFQYLHKSDWTQYVRVIHYGNGLSAFEGANTTNSVWMQEPSNNKFFNLKLAVDMTANASDNAQSDITLKIWVNNVSQGALIFTVKAEELKNIYIVGSEASPISFRTPIVESPEPEPEPKPETPKLEEALEGYTRVTLNDFEGLVATKKEAGTRYTTEARGTYNGESLNKTYLDFDINFNDTLTNYMHYLAEGDWANYKRISLAESGLSVWDPDNTAAGSIWAQADTYGIKANEFFNVKVRADIVPNGEDASKEDVTLQLWINNSYVGERTWTEDAHMRNLLYLYVGSGSVLLRTPVQSGEERPEVPEVSEALKGYTQVTPKDFAIIEGDFTHGWVEGNWMGYEYPESLNHAYFDVDISFCNDANFQNTIRYLSVDGWQSLQIGIVEEEFKVFETSTNTLLYRVVLSDIGIKADALFNMKLSTDISNNASDSTKKDIALRLWVNDKIVSAVTGEDSIVIKGCTTVGNMLGVYLPNQGTICIKSPKNEAGNEQKPNTTQQPDSSFKEITFGNFAIKDGQYGYVGTKLGAEGTYIFSVNRTVFSGDFHFSRAAGADFRYGGKGNPWNGLRFWTTGDGKLYMQDVMEKTAIYTFHPMYAGVQLVDSTFNMKLSVEFVDSDNDGAKDDVKLGVWFNDVLYRDAYIYLTDYAKELGNACSVYIQKLDAWIRISSDKDVNTGVDFTLFGFTKNWKQELGIVSYSKNKIK